MKGNKVAAEDVNTLKKAKKRKVALESPAAPMSSETAENSEAEVPQTLESVKKKKSKTVDSEAEKESEEVAVAVSSDKKDKHSASLFSDMKFSDLPISTSTKDALQSLGFERMTHIQAKSIPDCLAGSDLIGAAKTGSGKVITFLTKLLSSGLILILLYRPLLFSFRLLKFLRGCNLRGSRARELSLSPPQESCPCRSMAFCEILLRPRSIHRLTGW